MKLVKASTAANIAVLTVEQPPSLALAGRFHAFVIPSIVPAQEFVQLNNDSEWGTDPTEN